MANITKLTFMSCGWSFDMFSFFPFTWENLEFTLWGSLVSLESLGLVNSHLSWFILFPCHYLRRAFGIPNKSSIFLPPSINVEFMCFDGVVGRPYIACLLC